MSKNDVTGDEITSKTSTEAYRENYELIFGKPRMKISRIDVIGANGNDGEHYQEVENNLAGQE